MSRLGAIGKNLVQYGATLPRGLLQLQKDVATAHQVKLKRDEGREKREPLAQDSFNTIAWRFTQHEANAFVDKELDVPREQFRLYRNIKKDLLLAAPFASPVFFGLYGLIPPLVSFSNEHFLPSAFTRKEGESFNQQMIRKYKEYIDDKRLKFGPHVQRNTLTLSTIQLGNIPPELVSSYRNLFWNHVDNEHAERDVTKLPEFAAYARGDLNLHGADGRNISFAEYFRHALDFLGDVHQFGTPYVFGPWSQNFEDYRNRLLNWFEDTKQDTYLIKRAGGPGALSDEELLLSCLDRAIARVEENLTRRELIKRLDDWMYLEDTNVEIPFMLSWAGGYHWDHQLDLTDHLEQQHLWKEEASKLPRAAPDLDPFLKMQVAIEVDKDQERLVETFREVWSRSTIAKDRGTLFNALAELIDSGAPEYVSKLRPDVRRALVSHVTANVLQRGLPAHKAEGDEAFKLPKTAEYELGSLINERENTILPKACNPNAYRSQKSFDVEEFHWPEYLPMDTNSFSHPQMELAWLKPRVHGKDAVSPVKVAI